MRFLWPGQSLGLAVQRYEENGKCKGEMKKKFWKDSAVFNRNAYLCERKERLDES